MGKLTKIITGGVLAGLIVRYGLPEALRLLGLHARYENYNIKVTGKALIIATNQSKLAPRDQDTGVASSEITHPYYDFQDAGMDVDVGSIKGGLVPVDPSTIGWLMLQTSEHCRRSLTDNEFQSKVKNSLSISDINVNDYDIIYLAGGWGAAYDFAQSPELGEFITQANASNKLIGSVCHGALGLVNAKKENGEPLLKGRRATGVTDKQIKELDITVTPKHPETEMRKNGVIFESETAFKDPFARHTVVDGNLITGQNQNDAGRVAQELLKLLKSKI